MAAHMRQSDYDEALAFYGDDPRERLLLSYAESDVCWAGFLDEEPVCIFGVVCYDLLLTTGFPWFVGTDKLLTAQKSFLKLCRPYVRLMQGKYTHLTNWVDVRNEASIKWLKWLGAEFFGPEPSGPGLLPFWRFELGGSPC